MRERERSLDVVVLLVGGKSFSSAVTGAEAEAVRGIREEGAIEERRRGEEEVRAGESRSLQVERVLLMLLQQVSALREVRRRKED